MFTKLVDYLVKNSDRFDLRALKYTTGTIAMLYILSNFPPRPPGGAGYYMMRKY